LAEALTASGVKVTRIARELSVGGWLEHAVAHAAMGTIREEFATLIIWA